MFAWVGSQFDAVLSTYVLGVVSSLMAGIAPIALTAMTIWVSLYGWAVLRNEVSETVPTFLWKVFKISLVLAFALQSGFYIANVSIRQRAGDWCSDYLSSSNRVSDDDFFPLRAAGQLQR